MSLLTQIWTDTFNNPYCYMRTGNVHSYGWGFYSQNSNGSDLNDVRFYLFNIVQETLFDLVGNGKYTEWKMIMLSFDIFGISLWLCTWTIKAPNDTFIGMFHWRWMNIKIKSSFPPTVHDNWASIVIHVVWCTKAIDLLTHESLALLYSPDL